MSRTDELGSSDSARSRHSIQVTMAADGISSALVQIWSRRWMNISR
jgi:hypothetical protein